MAKRLLSLLLSSLMIVLLAAPASAHTHPGDAEPTYQTSSWAQAEVAQASEIGLIPHAFQDYTAPVTRLEFTEFAIQYLAKAEYSSPDAYIGMALLHLAERDEDGNLLPVFSDIDTPPEQSPATKTILAAHALGLVQGRGDGTFDSEAPITRQEAATLLLNTYKALGGSPAEEDSPSRFVDAVSIPDYAAEGVGSMVSMSVMNGTGEDHFSPAGTYTVEQCAISFLHLWTNAPVSLVKGNVSPRFTYEQASAYVSSLIAAEDADVGYMERARWTGPEADLVRLDWGGTMHPYSLFYLIRRNGSLQELDLGICYYASLFPTTCTLDEAGFTEDGGIFTCSITVPETIRAEDRVLHAAGTYDVLLYVSNGLMQQYDYEDAVFYVENFSGTLDPEKAYTQTARLDGPTGTLIRKDRVSETENDAVFFLIRKDGSFLQLDMGLPAGDGTFQADWATDDLAFSEDGQSITGTVAVAEDVLQDGEVLLKAGTYPFSIDVVTGVVSLLS